MRPVDLQADAFNEDEFLDLVVANNLGNDVGVMLGAGDGTFAAPSLFNVGMGPLGVVTADLDGNGGTDVLTADAATVTILMASGFGFMPPVTLMGVGAPSDLTLGEMSSDANVDLVVADGGGNGIFLRLGTGGSGFGGSQAFATDTGPQAVVAVDLNEDDDTDVATANAGAGNVAVRYGDGLGGFGPAIPFNVGGAPRAMITDDIDGDMHADLAVASATSNEVTVLLGTGSGVFEDAQSFSIAADAQAIAAGDLNEDGVLDLLVTHGTQDLLSLLLSDA